jgi:hypothetical protein
VAGQRRDVIFVGEFFGANGALEGRFEGILELLADKIGNEQVGLWLLHLLGASRHIVRRRVLNRTKKQIANIAVELALEGAAHHEDKQHSAIGRRENHERKEGNKVNEVHALDTVDLAEIEPHMLDSPEPDAHCEEPIHLVVDRAVVEVSLHCLPQHHSRQFTLAAASYLNQVADVREESDWDQCSEVNICSNRFEIAVRLSLPRLQKILGHQVAD